MVRGQWRGARFPPVEVAALEGERLLGLTNALLACRTVGTGAAVGGGMWLDGVCTCRTSRAHAAQAGSTCGQCPEILRGFGDGLAVQPHHDPAGRGAIDLDVEEHLAVEAIKVEVECVRGANDPAGQLQARHLDGTPC